MKVSEARSESIPPDLELMQRYLAMRAYIALADKDIELAVAAWPRVQPHVRDLVDDFYTTILSQPNAAAAIRGGEQQVARLKLTLERWLAELFVGKYDRTLCASDGLWVGDMSRLAYRKFGRRPH